MIFGHPTSSWHKCGTRPGGTFPMNTAMGPNETMNCFFCPKMSYFVQKTQNLGQKMGNLGLNPLQEVADGSHGGLGRVQKGKNGLEVGQTF